MRTVGERSRRSIRTIRKMFRFLVLTFCLFAFVSVACGSDGGESAGNGESETGGTSNNAESRIYDRPAVLNSDDLVSAGLKSGKKYDVSTLPGGVSSGVFFWRIDNVAVQFEARFYESHSQAVELGTAPAEEGSGEDAILDERDAVYKEGVRDRRTVFDFRGTPRPRYGAYAIYANMVLLCEGKDDEMAWNQCSAVIQALDNR